MKCPKCGTEIKDGNLYCEKCGEEIHIVPDFEPEIEYSMRQTLSGIVEDVLEEVPKEQEEFQNNTGCLYKLCAAFDCGGCNGGCTRIPVSFG